MEIPKNVNPKPKADTVSPKDKRKLKMDPVLQLHNDVEFQMHGKLNPPSEIIAATSPAHGLGKNKSSKRSRQRSDDPSYEADEEDEDYNDLNSHSPSPVHNPYRLFRSHFSVYEALQNPELNNMDIFDKNKLLSTNPFVNSSNTNAPNESTFLSTSSWQNISNSYLDLSDNSNGTPIHHNPSSVNSILSSSDDNDDDHHHYSNNHDSMFRNLEELQRNSRNRHFVTRLLNHRSTDEQDIDLPETFKDRAAMNRKILNKLKADGEFDEEYDSDESGTFDLKLNNRNSAIVTENLNSQNDTSSGDVSSSAISPSFVMPKMLVSFKDSEQRSEKVAKICVLGNGSRIIKNKLVRVIDNPSFLLNYSFTKLNSEVDLVILIFDSESGLYFKEVLDYIASFGKLVLPIVNTVMNTSKNGNINSTSSLAGIPSDDIPFNIEDAILIEFLEMCHIKVFNTPIKTRISESDPSALYDLNILVSSYFNSKLEKEVASDYVYDLAANEYVNISDSDYYCEGSRRFRAEEYYDHNSDSENDEEAEDDIEELGDVNDISIISDGNSSSKGRPELIQLSTSLWVSSLIKSTDESTHNEYNDADNISSLISSNQDYDRGKKRRHSSNSTQLSKRFPKKKKKKNDTADENDSINKTPLICFGFGLSIATVITILFYFKSAQHSDNFVPKIDKINRNIWKSQDVINMKPEMQDLFTQELYLPLLEGLSKASIMDNIESLIHTIENSILEGKGLVYNSVSYIRQFVHNCAGVLLETFDFLGTNF